MNKAPSAPAISKDKVEMPRRPQTQGYDTVQVLEVTADQIRAMTDDQLRELCDMTGIATKPGWARSRLLTELTAASVDAAEY